MTRLVQFTWRIANLWLKNVYSAKNSVRRYRRIKKVGDRYLLVEQWRAGREVPSLLVNVLANVISIISFFALSILAAIAQGIIYSEESRVTLVGGRSIKISIGGNLSDRYTALAALILMTICLAFCGYSFLNASRLYKEITSPANPFKKRAEESLRKLGSDLPETSHVAPPVGTSASSDAESQKSTAESASAEAKPSS